MAVCFNLDSPSRMFNSNPRKPEDVTKERITANKVGQKLPEITDGVAQLHSTLGIFAAQGKSRVLSAIQKDHTLTGDALVSLRELSDELRGQPGTSPRGSDPEGSTP